MTLPALLLCSLLSAAAAPPPSEIDLAQEHFQRGRQLFKDHHFLEALQAFEQAQAQVDSPNVALYLGRCLVELGRLVEAHAQLLRAEDAASRLTAHDGRYQPTAQAAAEERRAVRARLGALRIQLTGAPDDAEVRVAGRRLERHELEGELLVVPGPVPVEVDAPGFARLAQSPIVAAGQTQTLLIALQPLRPAPPVASVVSVAAPATEERAPRWARTLTLTGVAVALVGGAAGGGLAVATQRQHDAYVAACVRMACSDADAADRARSGRRTQLFAQVALGTGLAGATAAFTGYVLGRVLPERVPVAVSTDGRRLLLAVGF